MKPGYKTTEFWVTLITQILGILQMFGVIKPEEAVGLTQGTGQIVGGVMTVAPAIGYAISRGRAKQKATQALVLALLVPALLAFTAATAPAAIEWVPANQVTVSWDAVTTDTNGNPLPAAEIRYVTFYANESDTAKANPVTVGTTTGIEQVFTFAGEGRFILGVRAERVQGTTVVATGPISWSDNPAVCADGKTFGVSRYAAPGHAGGLKIKIQ